MAFLTLYGNVSAGNDRGWGEAVDKPVPKKSDRKSDFLFANRVAIEDIRSWKFRGTSVNELSNREKP